MGRGAAEGGGAGVNAQEIMQAAYQLLGAPYRRWHPGDPIPMWRKDGVGDPPPAWHLHNVGVMSPDMLNFALEWNGLPPGGGTGTFGNYLVRTLNFEPSSPGEVGAVAFRPYHGPQDDGSLALYVGAHQVIMSIPGEGVTDQYTDEQIYARPEPRYRFTIYGFLPKVIY
jgi:hypothetical protein